MEVNIEINIIQIKNIVLEKRQLAILRARYV